MYHVDYVTELYGIESFGRRSFHTLHEAEAFAKSINKKTKISFEPMLSRKR